MLSLPTDSSESLTVGRRVAFLFLGADGVIVITLSAHFGHLLIIFDFYWPNFATAAWRAGVLTFLNFMAARSLNGLL
jgi:hypothetical protein